MQCDKDASWEQSHIGESTPMQTLASTKQVPKSAPLHPHIRGTGDSGGAQGTSSGTIFWAPEGKNPIYLTESFYFK